MLVIITNIISEDPMSEESLKTADKIIIAASELFQEKGFHPVSMKNIANQANVSEMTVFRHFSSKKQVLEAVVKKMSYLPSLKEIFVDQIRWDLESDLLILSSAYQKIMTDNQLVFLITLREEKTIPEVSEFVRQEPPEFKLFLQNYFCVMEEKKKIVKSDAEALALAFMAINFGFFFFKVRGYDLVNISDSQFIDTTIRLFAKGIKT